MAKKSPSKQTEQLLLTKPSTMGIVLGCPCGEELFLLGREEDWRKGGWTVFECGVCREELSLDDFSIRRDETTTAQLFIPSILSTFLQR